MATKVIKSASNQPIYLNLPGGRSVKIPARQTVEIEEADLASPEMAFYRNRGSVVVVETPAKAGGGAGKKTKITQRKRGEDEIVDEKGGN